MLVKEYEKICRTDSMKYLKNIIIIFNLKYLEGSMINTF